MYPGKEVANPHLPSLARPLPVRTSREHTVSNVHSSLSRVLSLPFRAFVNHGAHRSFSSTEDDTLPPFVRAVSREVELAQHPWLRWNPTATLTATEQHEPALKRMRAQYLGCVSEVDAAMGELFGWLKAEGLWDKTMVVRHCLALTFHCRVCNAFHWRFTVLPLPFINLPPPSPQVLTADHGEQLGDHWQLGKLGYFR